MTESEFWVFKRIRVKARLAYKNVNQYLIKEEMTQKVKQLPTASSRAKCKWSKPDNFKLHVNAALKKDKTVGCSCKRCYDDRVLKY